MKKVSNNTETSNPEWDASILKYMGDINITEIEHYKFRAECEHEVNELLVGLGMKCLKMVKTIAYYFPDTEVDLHTTLSLAEIRNAIRKIADGHVMLQTVALAAEYTGERNFDLV